MKTLIATSTVIVIQFLMASAALAQGGGMGAGGAGAGAAYNAYQNQNNFRNNYWGNYVQTDFITVEGSAIRSLKPESLRLVFAVTAQEKTSLECTTKVHTTIKQIRSNILNIGIDKKDVVEDFIVIVPSYLWKLETYDNSGKWEKSKQTQYLREHPDGFRMQTNLHVQCKDEQQALKVMEFAFREGVTEIVSFDYWHSNLDQIKKDVLKSALEEAKEKSSTLLSVFDEKPQILNVANSIEVKFPEALYKTITPTPANAQDLLPNNWHSYLRIAANRPLTTFYAGPKEYEDSSRLSPTMNPEISVHSKVTLTYGSPSWKEGIEIQKLKANSEASNSKSEK